MVYDFSQNLIHVSMSVCEVGEGEGIESPKWNSNENDPPWLNAKIEKKVK